MASPSSVRIYHIVVGILALITVGILVLVGLVLALTRPPSARAVAATLTALPNPIANWMPTPTPVPTLPDVSPELLLCQRQASQAMNARNMLGAANISDDRLFLLKWVSWDRQIADLEGALGGVIQGFDVALDVWEGGCAVYDRLQIEVYDRREEAQTHQLTVRAQMDDLLRWREGELNDSALLARLEVTQAGQAP